MIWILIILSNLFIGSIIGGFIVYYKNRNLLNNQNILYNELQNCKNKLNEYEKTLKVHFKTNIELLDSISENYQNLYKNIIKNANFFLPNTYTQNNIYPHYIKNIYDKDEKKISIEIPKDYSENIDNKKTKEK